MFVEPHGVRANSWEDVADLSYKSGIVLDGWQELILQAAMGERSDATWAAKRVGVSVPRQNGKSQLMVARILAGVLLFDEKKIVVSAHQADTSRESFNKLVEILEADGNGWLMDRVKPNGIMNAINREAIKFKNGAVVQFKARTGSGGRGFSSDCLMLDEAQRLKRPAWVSINSTMSAMPNPQVWLLGTPPTREDYDGQMGEVFESIRTAARDGVSTAAAWAEWGSDPSAEGFDPASEFTRWSGNPAWNTRINHEIVQGEFESYTAEEFALDRLGIWLSDLADVGGPLAPLWGDLAVDEAPAEGQRAFGVAFSADGMRMSVGGAILSDDSAHVELIDAVAGDTDAGLAGLADWFVERVDGVPRWRRASAIVISGRAGAAVLERLLLDRKVPQRRIILPSSGQYFAACGMLLDSARDGSLSHLDSEGQEALDLSVKAVTQEKRSRDGAWGWTAVNGDETPAEAVSLALYGARTGRKPTVMREKRGVIL